MREFSFPSPALIFPADRTVREPIPVKIDYVARKAKNRQLGRMGEELALQYEKARLAMAGKPYLASAVEWVSESRGDGLGYDIASFDLEEQEICIEVKTTNLSAQHPFYVTERELTVSRLLGNRYRLYRLHQFSQTPHLFELTGDLSNSLSLDPIVYRAFIP